MDIKCTRCEEEFSKNNYGRIRKIVDMSVHGQYLDGRVNHMYYLCPKCAAAFIKWANYPKLKKKKKGD